MVGCWLIIAATVVAQPPPASPSGAPPTELRWQYASLDEPSSEPHSHEAEEPEVIGLRPVFEDGFALQSTDGEFELKTHILGQFDLKIFEPTGQEPSAHTGAYIPRVRVYFEGRLTEPLEYEVSLQRSLEGQFDLLDANFNYRLREERLQFKVGRQLVPYSYAWYDHLEQYFLAPERALFPLNFGLSRANGASLWGTLGDGVVQYAIAGVDGRVAGLADNNSSYDGVGYLNLRPFLHTDRFSLLRYLNIGGSLAIGETYEPEQPLPLRTSVQSSENDESAIAASAVFLEWNDDVRGDGGRMQSALHIAWYAGGWTVECEWQSGRHGMLKLSDGSQATMRGSGFHAGVGYLLTGETLEGRKAIHPLRPIDPRHGGYGLGAFELFARYADIKLSDDVFTDGLVDPNLWTNQAFTTDIGVNWYWNSFIKWTFDWQHAGYGSPVLVNEVKDQFSRTEDLFWFRGQVYF